MTEAGRILVVLALAAPLLMAPASIRMLRPARMLPWAALPGLLAALLAPRDETVALPGILLGVGLRLDALGAVFLGFAAFLWLCAGAYAAAYLHGGTRERGFCVFWHLTLAGTLGAFMAADAVTFYISFAFLSLAAYGLVIHDRTEAAWRAGRIYIVLAVLGEICLLLGLLLAADAAGSILIQDMRTALAASPWRDYAILGLLAGFGLKAGLLPLHVWLPLAHSAAPVPASAVLSGAIVKAGIIGLIRFLPMEAALPVWAGALTWLGLATAYYGVLLGLAQHHPKAVLAYSTMSQMGLLVAVLGAGLGTPAVGATHAAAALYAVHHGLAKGALFLAVGVIAASGTWAARPVLAVAALLGAAIAGLPFTGGALAKLAIKGPLGEGAAALLASLSAVGTMLLMLRFLVLAAGQRAQDPAARPPAALLAAFAATTLAALAVPWLLFPELAGRPPAEAATPAALQAALWPILAALAVAAAAWWAGWPQVRAPVGDIAVLGETAARRLAAAWRGQAAVRPIPPRGWNGLGRRAGLAAGEVERRLSAWPVGGTALLAVAVLLGLALA